LPFLSDPRRCGCGLIRGSIFDCLQNSETKSAMSAASPGNRRWFRFGLRTMLLALTVLCVWLGFKVNAAGRQRDAAQAILKAGGTVAYDYQLVPVPGIPNFFNIDTRATLSVPGWLRSIFGDDFFCNVIYVGFTGTGADFELTRLAELPSIERIAIKFLPPAQSGGKPQMHLRDDDLAVFGKLSQLQQLELHRQEFEGTGLRSLVGLKHLQHLGLYGTPINDTGLEQVGKLTTLQNIVLSADRISDAGLHCLSTIPKLNLDLMGPSVAQISDSRLEALSRLGNLDNLSFHKAHFANETSLSKLQILKNLGGLHFLDCDVTDAALESLRKLTNLHYLRFEKSKATAQGIRELQKALPNTTVVGP
jgi:hypothetical protein